MALECMLLSRLVADLQELAQAEAGQLTLVPQAVAVGDCGSGDRDAAPTGG